MYYKHKKIRRINYLFKLLETFLTNKINDFNKENIKFTVIGEKKFPRKINKLLNNNKIIKSVLNTTIKIKRIGSDKMVFNKINQNLA